MKDRKNKRGNPCEQVAEIPVVTVDDKPIKIKLEKTPSSNKRKKRTFTDASIDSDAPLTPNNSNEGLKSDFKMVASEEPIADNQQRTLRVMQCMKCSDLNAGFILYHYFK